MKKTTLPPFLSKIYLMLWKNWIHTKRQYMITACEIILPTLGAIILADLNAKYGPPPSSSQGRALSLSRLSSNQSMEYGEKEAREKLEKLLDCSYDQIIGYVPGTKNDLTLNILKKAVDDAFQSSNCIVNYTEFTSENEMEIFYSILNPPPPATTPDRQLGRGFTGRSSFYPKYAVKFFPLVIIGMFVFIVPTVVRGVVSEKQTGIKELMKMSGLPEWLHWFGWMLNSLILYGITVTIIIIIVFVQFGSVSAAVFEHSDAFLFWVILMTYVLWATTFCFALSAFFERPVLAASLGFLLWYGSWFGLGAAMNNQNKGYGRDFSMDVKLLFCLFPNVAMYFTLEAHKILETSGKGAKWGNMGETLGGYVQVPLLYSFLMMFASIFLNMVICLYVEAVMPKKYGVRKPVYFIFLPSEWGCSRRFAVNKGGGGQIKMPDYEKPGFENEPIGSVAGVQLVNLRKEFGKRKVAVNDVSVNILKGQIFCLLGENGAGKTTTMSVLTGLLSPTSGTAFINGLNITTDMAKIRKSLGLCPQHNMLFDKMTVLEHLKFFGMLKGLSSINAKAEAMYLLQVLQFPEKQNVFAKNLSGGQKRKLSLGCSIIGGSKIVFLDEPTSGMDPEARRAIWDILLNIRQDRTIILTTHTMEEADVLGDRIGIMSSGKLQCCGSPTYLKRFYDAYFKASYSNNDAELSVVLPSENSPCSLFPALFSELTEKKEDLGIGEIGIGWTTMDDVFVKVEELSHGQQVNGSDNVDNQNSRDNDAKLVKVRGFKLLVSQFYGLLMKSIIWTYRKKGYNALSDVANKDDAKYRKRYIIAGQISGTDMKAMYSTSAPLSINMMTNTMLRGTSTVTVINYPLRNKIDDLLIPVKKPQDENKLDRLRTEKIFVGLMFGPVFTVGFVLLVGTFIIAPTEERLSKAKQLQLMTGVSPILYWGSRFIWDFFIILVTISLMIACLFIFESDDKAFTHSGGAGVLFLIMAVFGISALSLTYLLSAIVRTTLGGFILITILNLLFGTCLGCLSFLLEVYPLLDGLAVTTNFFGGFLPSFWATRGVIQYAYYSISSVKCSALTDEAINLLCDPSFNPVLFHVTRDCCDDCIKLFQLGYEDYCVVKVGEYANWVGKIQRSPICLTPPNCDNKQEIAVGGIGQDMTWLVALAVVYFAILFMIDYGIFKSQEKGNVVMSQRTVADDDVVEESNRIGYLVQQGQTNQDSIMIHNLGKSYDTFLAVNSLSFGVHHGECFGLLGVNGAGKTTTFRMLTGDENRSWGNAYVQRLSLSHHRKQFSANLGYCPQFDAFVEGLTGKQMLALFARLRGVPFSGVKKETEKWLRKTGLLDSGNVKWKNYSGGMKRRLNTAMALIGDPQIILMDEPTSGVDPVARRQFWKIISSVKNSGQSIILTSHSMEECEALCSRLGIMVNGELQCLGGVQHLKSKFAMGYSLTIKLKQENYQNTEMTTKVVNDVLSIFDPCSLKDHHQTTMKFQIHSQERSWEDLYRTMEGIKEDNQKCIEEYAITETTLEEVFLSFARAQQQHARVIRGVQRLMN